MKKEAMPLRAHHLSRISVFDMSFEEYLGIMIKNGYSEQKKILSQ